MMDERNTRAGSPRSTTECPDFDLLSQFADDEADAGQAESLAIHIRSCKRCADLVEQLQLGLAVVGQPSGNVTRGSDCIDEETLILYMISPVSGDRRRRVDAHLGGCDACVIRLAQLHRRFQRVSDVEVPVPAAVRERARAAFETNLGELAAASTGLVREAKPWRERIEQRFSFWLRLPVLVPVSVAAGALLMVSLQETGLMTASPPGLTRAVQREAQLRVTAVEGRVHRQPSRRAEVVAIVPRGESLEVDGIERDWYRVTLADGRIGWIERDAFE
jgi:anti-sigma factor RsiW